MQTTSNSLSLQPGQARSVALIGAIPPKPLIETLFPEVDWGASPRFATKAVRDVLCAEDPEHAATKLAALGYDTPLIALNDSDLQNGPSAAERTLHWQDVRKDLKNTREALSFGCSMEEAVCADHVLAKAGSVDYRLQLAFTGIDSNRPMANYEERCGLFWQLDIVRHQVECLLVAGLRGQYRFNSKMRDAKFIISTPTETLGLSHDGPVVLKADNQGVLSFKILSLDPTTNSVQKCDFLTKTLADSDLNLEWLGHG